jgi:hypothetical protein
MHEDDISVGILAEYNALRKERSNAITAMEEETQKISVVQSVAHGFFIQPLDSFVRRVR